MFGDSSPTLQKLGKHMVDSLAAGGAKNSMCNSVVRLRKHVRSDFQLWKYTSKIIASYHKISCHSSLRSMKEKIRFPQLHVDCWYPEEWKWRPSRIFDFYEAFDCCCCIKLTIVHHRITLDSWEQNSTSNLNAGNHRKSHADEFMDYQQIIV